MQAKLVFIALVLCLSCSSEVKKELKEQPQAPMTATTDSIPVSEVVLREIERIQKTNPSQPEMGVDTFVDAIPIFGDYYLYLEHYSITDFAYQIRRKKSTIIENISKLEKTMCLFDRTIIKDYNFDGEPDLNVITLACNNAGSNPFNHIFLASNDSFIEARISGYAFPTLDTTTKKVHSIHRMNGHFTFASAIWVEDSLMTISELELHLPENNHFRGISEYRIQNDSLQLFKEYVVPNLVFYRLHDKIAYW